MILEGRVLIVFVCSLFNILLVVWLNIRLLRRRIKEEWDSNATRLFVFSLGQFGEQQRHRWEKLGYDAEDAKTIVSYQLCCLAETPLGFIVSIAVDHHFFHP